MKAETMADIIIKGLPESAYRKLVARADRNRQVVEDYLVEVITEMTEELTMEEWLERVAEHREAMPPIEGVDTVALIKAGRAERDANIARALGFELGDDGAYRAGL